MSYNGIIRKIRIGSVMKNGKEVLLSMATETTHWKRPEFLADSMKERATKYVADHDKPLPADTEEVCIREAEHQSDKDKRGHVTGVCFNSKGEGKSVHFLTN